MVSRPRQPTAILDANVLYLFHLRNLLIQCAVDSLAAVRGTDFIHDQWSLNLAAKTPSLSVARLQRIQDLMEADLPDAHIAGRAGLLNQSLTRFVAALANPKKGA